MPLGLIEKNGVCSIRSDEKPLCGCGYQRVSFSLHFLYIHIYDTVGIASPFRIQDARTKRKAALNFPTTCNLNRKHQFLGSTAFVSLIPSLIINTIITQLKVSIIMNLFKLFTRAQFIFIAGLSFLLAPNTPWSTIGTWGIGASTQTDLCSSSTWSWTPAPWFPVSPVAVDCFIREEKNQNFIMFLSPPFH